MVQNRINDFKFFVPLEISKAKDADGEEVMKIGGIASTADKDSDNEVLEPEGFDLSYFLKNGFINWNHQSKTNPATVIGEPTKAEITDKGLYIEGELYKDSPVAKQVWDLAKTLEKSSKNRRLGFSIEGKALERDLLDKKRITKAKITGVAITASPKNPCTIMDILKGEATGFESEYNVSETSQTDANGGDTFIIDVLKPNGERIVVDKDYNVKIIQKSLDTVSGEALKRESVESNLKKLEENEKKIKKSFTYSNETGNFVSLNKANLFSEICTFTNDISKAKQVTEQVFENLNNFDMVNKEIKNEEIVKALASLGIENADEIVKAGMSEDLPDDNEEGKGDENKKQATPVQPEKEDGDEDLEEMEKSLAAKQDEIDNLKTKIQKKKASSKQNNEEENFDISKSFDTFKAEASDLIEKSNQEISDKLDNFFTNFNQFQKSIEERFEKLESEPAVGRKSITTSSFIEKSFGNEQQNDLMKGKTSLSMSKNKQQVSDLLLAKSGIEKGEVNDFYVNALTGFEATGEISKSVVNDLFHNHNVLVTQ